MHPLLLVLLLAAGPSEDSTASARILGRTPVDSVFSILSARFVSSDIDDLLAVENLGRVRLPIAGSAATQASLTRLSLLRLAGERFRVIWQSEPLLESAVPTVRLSAGAWTVGDVNSDGLSELLLFTPESCRVISFGPDSVRTQALPMPGAWVTDAVVCDLADDAVPQLVTLELSPLDSALSGRLLRAYRISDSAVTPSSDFIAGMDWGPDVKLDLLGSCRLPEYWGELPVIAGIYPTLRPSAYAVVTQSGDSLKVTTRPFPLQAWFSKERVLPSGPLSLHNVEDTLVARGYFVPGSGTGHDRNPSGISGRIPGRPRPWNFAALQDGEWRILPLTEAGRRITGPVCRFTLAGVSGWLELRDSIFRFSPGEIFSWR